VSGTVFLFVSAQVYLNVKETQLPGSVNFGQIVDTDPRKEEQGSQRPVYVPSQQPMVQDGVVSERLDTRACPQK
jgi:hypothetical protein